MSKHPHRTDPTAEDGGSNGKSGSTPYSLAARRARSRGLAQKRRNAYKSIMDDLTQALPFPKDVVSQLDYNSRLRLSLCFFRLKTLLANGHTEPETKAEPRGGEIQDVDEGVWPQVMVKSAAKPVEDRLVQPGMLQSMMAEALDGFLLVASSEGTIVYLSESVHHHLGIFQSEHIGVNIYDIISEEDHETVREAISGAEAKVMSFGLKKNRGAQVEFFCRMKCSRFKVANTITKSPGFKVVYVSGSIKVMRGSHFLVTVVRPVSPPSLLEIRMEANMFVSHYGMDLKCVFFDGRLNHLLGYGKVDLEGVMPHFFKHKDDLQATAKCSQGIVTRGEGMSGYYRFLTHHGFYVWLQTRATLMYDSRTGKPTHLVCLNYIISKEEGDKELEQRHRPTPAIKAAISEVSAHSYDPFPITHRMDGSVVNPFPGDDDSDFDLSRKGRGGVTVVKEEFLEQPKSIPDSGVHSDSNSLQQTGSCYGSSSSVFHSISTGSPSGSANYSDANYSDCLPDSTTDLLTSDLLTSELSSIVADLGQSKSSIQTELTMFDSEISSSSETEHRGQAPSGQAPLGHVPSGQTPLGHVASVLSGQAPLGWGQAPLGQVPSGQGHAPSGHQTPLGHAPTGSVPSSGRSQQQSPPTKPAPVDLAQTALGCALLEPPQPPNQTVSLGMGLPAWERDQYPRTTTSLPPNSSTSDVLLELGYGKIYYQGNKTSDVPTSQNFYQPEVQEIDAMPLNGYLSSYDAGAVPPAQKARPYGLNTTAAEQRLYPQASDSIATPHMPCSQNSSYKWYNVDTMVTAHTMNPVSFGSVTMEMAQETHPQASVAQFNTRPGCPSESQIHNNFHPIPPPLIANHDTRPEDTLSTGVWSGDMLPLLTGEDLDMLDLVTKST